MAKKLALLSLLFFSFSLEFVNAQTNSNGNAPKKTNIILTDRNIGGPKRPKAPSQQQISCFYENESLHLSFAVPEGECQLTVTDMTTGFARQYVFDSSAEASVNVGALTQAHIEISTASGHEYEGWLGVE